MILRANPSCIMDLEPGLPCPEEIAWVIENTANKVKVTCCHGHKEPVVAMVDPECVRVMSLQEWEMSGREL